MSQRTPLPVTKSELDRIHHRLQTDLLYFAKVAPVLIKGKEMMGEWGESGGDAEDGESKRAGESGALIKWVPTRGQLYLHERTEDQLRRKGRVRLLILKARQVGCSTYISIRGYHKSSRNPGTSVFVLSHDASATGRLFKMVTRVHDNVAEPLRPEVGASNKNQMTFPRIESDYGVGTAGNENVSRGGTSQFIHWSEPAYCEHAYAIQDGMLETVGDMPGTEIFLESTANGPNGLFYDMCRNAMHGVGDYELVFIPWFWQDEYEREDDFSPLTEEEDEYVNAYLLKEYGLARTRRKILWRRAKILQYKRNGSLEVGQAKFRQIYPANPVEAFQSTAIGLYRADAMTAARKSILTDPDAPLIVGVDVAGDSDNADRTTITYRRGRHWIKTEKYSRMRGMQLAGILAHHVIEKDKADKVFVDMGFGRDVVDRLWELGHRRTVQGVWFGEASIDPRRFRNKRSEMFIASADWVNGGDVRIPDDDDVHSDLAAIPLDEEDSNGVRYIKSTREIKKLNGGLSPDIVSSFILTFAYKVHRAMKETGEGYKKVEKRESPLRSMRRMRR